MNINVNYQLIPRARGEVEPQSESGGADPEVLASSHFTSGCADEFYSVHPTLFLVLTKYRCELVFKPYE